MSDKKSETKWTKSESQRGVINTRIYVAKIVFDCVIMKVIQ